MYRTYLTFFLLISFFPFLITITLFDLHSPCPDIFKYLNYSSIDRTWYGELTLLSETDLNWIRILITFKTPPLYFGTSYGSVLPLDEKTYTIVNLEEKLKVHVPKRIQFYVVHEYLKWPAELFTIQLNSEVVCTTTDYSSFSVLPPAASLRAYDLEGFRFVVEYQNDEIEARCSDVVVYDNEHIFGTLTMLSKTNTDESEGVWMRLIFDAPVILRSSYGNVTRTDDRTYVIQNFRDQLIGDKPKRVKFVLEYNRSKPIPKLISFHHAGKQECNAYFLQETNDMPVKHANQNQANGSSDKDISCGTVAIRPKPLITYGEESYEGEFPWHVALYRLTGVDLKYICGASLISKRFVITAAHCATKPRTTTSVNPENLFAYLGKLYLSQNSIETVQDKRISDITIHPQYNANNLFNDVALLKLALPAEYNNFVRPVCLWQDSINLGEILNKPGNVVGWGSDQTGYISEQLMQAFMPIVSLDTCIFSFREFYAKFVTSNTYCAGYINGTSVCSGDSGGGMVFPTSSSNPKYPIWQLRGLVSLGATLQGVNFKCDSSNYVIFTDIAKYLDWIQNIIN